MVIWHATHRVHWEKNRHQERSLGNGERLWELGVPSLTGAHVGVAQIAGQHFSSIPVSSLMQGRSIIGIFGGGGNAKIFCYTFL